MGVLLDSSAIISSERSRETALQFVERLYWRFGEVELGMSAIVYTELVQGIHRSEPETRRISSRLFLDDLIAILVVQPFTREVAELAGRISAEQKKKGLAVPFPDLLIGATALHLNFSILTVNERHFRLIPGLDVISF